MTRRITIKEKIDTILVYLIIATSGIPFFVGSYYLMPMSLAFALFIAYKRKINIADFKMIVVLVILLIIAFFREILNGGYPSPYVLAVIVLKYSFPFIVLKITRQNFLVLYVRVIYYLSIISLFIFTLIIFINPLEAFFVNIVCPLFKQSTKSGFYNYAPNMLFYTFGVSGRNHGPFWEAGGFGAFLIIGIIFNYILTQNIFDKRGIVMIISLITTFSTASYIALFFIFLGYSFSRTKINKRLLYLAVIMLISFYSFNRLYFLRNKVESHLSTIHGNYESRVANRFTSILIDFERIVNHPVFGNPQSNKGEHTIYDHRNNGLSSMAVEYGIIYFLLFFLLVYKSFKKNGIYFGTYNRKVFLLFFMSIFAMYFSQVLTDKPMMNLLAFFSFIKYKNIKYRSTSTEFSET